MRFNVRQMQQMKKRGEKIAVLTAYDYPTAKLIDELGIPIILVGDSLGMVVLGYDTTIPVTVDDIIHHTRAVVRGSTKALVVADMPFMSYRISSSDTLKNAARMIQEGGAQAVKLEGGENVSSTVREIVDNGIPVMGHIGLTPQSVHQLGGYKVVGKTKEAATRLLADAEALDEAGVFAIVLETIPIPLAGMITKRVRVPTIGIGAGVHCDGQVQVVSDILGLYTDFVPKHTKQYADLAKLIKLAISDYISEVRWGKFPGEKESSTMRESILEDLFKSGE